MTGFQLIVIGGLCIWGIWWSFSKIFEEMGDVEEDVDKWWDKEGKAKYGKK